MSEGYTHKEIFSAMQKLMHIYRIIETVKKYYWWDLFIRAETLDQMEKPELQFHLSPRKGCIYKSSAVISGIAELYNTKYKQEIIEDAVYGEVVRYTLNCNSPKIIIDFISGKK